MATASLILDTRRADKRNFYPLKIRIVHKNNNVSISTGVNIPIDVWELGKNGMEINKKFPDAKTLNLELSAAFLKIQQGIKELEMSNKLDVLTAVQIKEYILNRSTKPTEQVTFISYFRKFAETRNAERTKKLYRHTLSKIVKWSNDYVIFEDVTVQWLNEFHNYLKKQGNKLNTIAINERNIRAVIKSAIDEEITDIKDPFRKYKIKQKTESDTMPLSIEQIKAIRDFETDSEAVAIARDVFMISFYLMGINVSDLYELKKIDRVRYIRHKTNQKYDFLMPQEALLLSEKYYDTSRMFNFYKRYISLHSFTCRINKNLKFIGREIGVPNLILYHARHTWATFATQLDILERTISECLGHKTKSITNRYARFDSRKKDEANRKVLDLLL